MQDDHRLDTNLLLFCCWHAHTRGRLDAATVLEALAISEPWATHVVGPLRAARTWMKLNLSVPNRTTIRQTDMAFRQQQLREQIKAVELQAEHLQEDLLESLLYGSGQGLSNTQPTLEKQMMDAMSNLESVLEASAVPLNDEINGLLAVLIGATLKTCGGPPSV